MPEVYQQYRSVQVGGIEAVADGSQDDLDMSIRVEESQEESLTFEVTIWNLADESWETVEEGSGAQIQLGWRDGPTSTVCMGIVDQKYPEPDGADRRYVVKGVDQSEAQVEGRYSASWTDRSPAHIVRDMATTIGLTEGNIEDPGFTLEGKWPIKDDKPLRHWIDELKHEAQDRTGDQWTWRVREGQMFFESKDEETVEAVVLSYGNTLIDLNQSIGGSEKDEESSTDDLDFRAYCEPNLRQGSYVAVDTDRHSGVYKATEVKFVSDTTSGDHIVEGTLAPADAEWSAEYPGTEESQDSSSVAGVGGRAI